MGPRVSQHGVSQQSTGAEATGARVAGGQRDRRMSVQLDGWVVQESGTPVWWRITAE